MRKLYVATLTMMLLTTFSSNVLLAVDANELVGQQFFTRTNLKPMGSVIVFHNISSAKGFIPAGTAVTIYKVGKEKIKFKLVDSGKKYTLTTLPDHYDKYFTKSLEDVGLKGLSDKIKSNVQNMTVEPGMKKAEVYIAKGCPAFIGHGKKSWFYSLDQIMESNSWYYFYNSRKLEMIVSFENGVVTNIEANKLKKINNDNHEPEE